jgi:prepilin peptidase CpaA
VNSLFWVTMFVLILALIYDIRFGRIPNWLTLPAMVVGLAYHFYFAGAHGLLLSACGLLVGFGIFVGLYLLGGMGAGDVKLMAAIGALLGPKDVFYAAVLTAIAGGIYAMVLILLNKTLLIRYGTILKTLLFTGHFAYVPGGTKTPSLRYGIAIAAGTMIVLFRRFV